nr:hypothetical protein [uncultured Campylobacter sp.]
MCPLRRFFAVYIININFASREFDTLADADFDTFVSGVPRKTLDTKNRAKMSDFYKFRGGILHNP